MKLISRIKRRIKQDALMNVFYPLKNLVIEFLSNNYILLSSSVSPVSHNWGDDASEWLIIHFLNPCTKIVQYKYSWNLRRKNNYLCIGSIISWMSNKKSIIWGSGLLYPEQRIKAPPLKVYAVRGPLTREHLVSYGVNCPEIYGDPALLFPLFYKPIVEKRYKYGIIPHFRDKQSVLLQQYRQDENVLIIDVENVKPWHKFIDDIASCDFIISSSLHGIIISDAYKVPNIWVEFSGGETKRFAFYDYLASVGKSDIEPILFSQLSDIDELFRVSLWKEPVIDIKKLLDVCPFIETRNEKSSI